MATGRDRILQIAPLLWGDRWQTAMAEGISINPRTLRRYLTGRRVPPEILGALEAALLERLGAIVEALDAPEKLKAGLRIEIDNVRGFRSGAQPVTLGDLLSGGPPSRGD